MDNPAFSPDTVPQKGDEFKDDSLKFRPIQQKGGDVSSEPAGKGLDHVARPAANEGDTVNLERRVGLVSGVALIVGTMIGSGIFVSPKGVLERTGSVGMSLVIWTACGGLSMLGALSYAELGTLLPLSGGEYAYYHETFKDLHPFWGQMPSFLLSWINVIVLKPSSSAIICLAFAEYIIEAIYFGYECSASVVTVKLITAVAICLITFVNCFSVTLATRVQNVFTAAKLIAIAIIIGGGVYNLIQGNTQYLSQGFQGTTSSYGDIATAFYSGLWAYDGWNNLNYVTEEIKNPFVNLPRAIMIGIPLVTICYVLVNISYLAVMSPVELLESEAVAVTFGNRMLGVFAFLMPLSVALSTFGSANGSQFSAGRLCYVAAREGHLVDVLSFVHVRRLTPTPALVFNAVIALLMIIPGDIGSLIDFFSFTAWIFYGGAMLALIILRRTRKDAARPYKVPLVVPVLVLVISVYLVIAPIVDNPQIEYLYATLFIFAGLIFYIPFVYYKVVLGCMGKVTVFLQLLLEIVPTQYSVE